LLIPWRLRAAAPTVDVRMNTARRKSTMPTFIHAQGSQEDTRKTRARHAQTREEKHYYHRITLEKQRGRRKNDNRAAYRKIQHKSYTIRIIQGDDASHSESLICLSPLLCGHLGHFNGSVFKEPLQSNQPSCAAKPRAASAVTVVGTPHGGFRRVAELLDVVQYDHGSGALQQLAGDVHLERRKKRTRGENNAARMSECKKEKEREGDSEE